MKRIWVYVLLMSLLSIIIMPPTLIGKVQSEDWGEDVRLTFTDERSTTPAIAVEGDNVHVVWSEAGQGFNYHLWYINSYDGGITWNSPTCLTNYTPVEVYGPKIAVYQNNVHIIWVDFNDRNIHYLRSVDNGTTWNSETILPMLVDLSYFNWDISVNENYLHVTYVDYNKNLYYVKSNDNGNTWGSPVQLIPTVSSSLFSAIEVNENIIHVVCDGKGPGNIIFDTYYIRSEDNGETWGQAINITQSLANHYLDLDIYEDNIYVVYRANYNTQIFLSYSQDNGNNWTRNIKITNSPGPIFNPTITTEKKRICIAWEDFRYGSPRIFIINSKDGGKTWNNETEITKTYSNWPDIITDETTLYLVWDDRRDGNEEIYFKSQNISIPEIKPSIDIDPNALNLRSRGRWITAYIELNEYYDINEINISSILLENCIPAEHHPYAIGDYDNDGIPDLMVKFDRSEVEDILTMGESVTITVTGNLFDGELFEGSDTIRVIDPP